MHTTTGPFAAHKSPLHGDDALKARVSTKRAPLFVRGLFVFELLLGAAHVAVVGFIPQLHHSLTRFVNLEAEGNVPSWFSSAQLLLVGALLLALAFARRLERAMFIALLCSAAAFVFLSLDETAQIHERIGTISDAILPGGDRAHTHFSRTGVWMFFLGPILVTGLIWWWRTIAPLIDDAYGRSLLAGGLVLFVFSATVPEALSNLIAHQPAWLTVEILFEELGEMAGITLVVWGLVEVCRSLRVTLRFDSN